LKSIAYECYVGIYMTKEEKAWLRARANLSNKSLTLVVREIILKAIDIEKSNQDTL